MAFNQVENAILAYAIERLKPEYERVYGSVDGNFYIGNNIRFIAIASGPDNGKLTVARHVGGKEWVPDFRITPVDCYNLVLEGECIAAAVDRLSAEGRIGIRHQPLSKPPLEMRV